MKKMIWMFILFFAGSANAAPSLTELVRKADRIARAKTSAAVFTMTIKTSSYTRNYKAIAWSDDRGSDEKWLIKLLGPALWRGYGTLKTGGQLKLYNPKNDHVTVVGSSMLGDSWMGSHFTNDDLVKTTQLDKHYDLKIVRQWKDKALGQPADFYDIAMYPKPTAPVAWGRIEYRLWTRGDVVMPVEARYYRRKADKKQKRTLAFRDVKTMAKRLVPATMVATVANKPGESTTVTYVKLKLNIKVPSSKFTEQALKR